MPREIILTRDENKGYFLVFRSEYDPNILADIKEIDGRWWNMNLKRWEVPINKSSVNKMLYIAKEYNFTFIGDKTIIKDILLAEHQEDQKYKAPTSDHLVKVIRKNENNLFFVFDYNPTLVDEIKEILPDARFIKNTRRVGWELPITVFSMGNILNYLKRPYVYCEDKDLANDILAKINNKAKLFSLSKASENNNDINVNNLRFELRNFQKVGVEYAINAKKTFIADDMGLGKTIEAIATFEATGVESCLIVCPASVKYNWKIEADKWLIDKKAVILELDKKNNVVKDFGNINIINYNMLTKIWPYIQNKGISMAVFDESHKLKSGKTNWTKTAVELSKSMEYVLLLSGTPIINRPADLIQQLKILNRLDIFGGEWPFKQRYCNLKRTEYGWDDSGASNLDELHDNLRSHCYIRRMKAQVLNELPEKQRSYIPLMLDNKEMGLYLEAKNDIANWIINNKNEIKKYFDNLKNIEDGSTAEFEMQTKRKVKYAETLIKISKLRKIVADSKVKYFCEWAEDFLNSGKKLLIFAVHHDIINKIEEQLAVHNPVCITGQTAHTDRQANTDKFQNDPNTKVMICNIQAGGVGLTLTAASDVAFIEFGWTLAEHSQAEDRVYRIGQRNNVNIWYFYSPDTIDIDMISTIQNKERVINAAVDGLYDESEYNSVLNITLKNLGM